MVEEVEQNINSNERDISFYLGIQAEVLASNPSDRSTYTLRTYRIIRNRAIVAIKQNNKLDLDKYLVEANKQYQNGRALLHARLNKTKDQQTAASLNDSFNKHTANLTNESLTRFNNYASTLFAICASGYTSIMFTQKILIETFGLAASGPAIPVIISLALFNIILDKIIFDLVEKLIREHYDKDFSLTLDNRELIKFAILVFIAIVCLSLGPAFYIIPAALLLYTAGYFINYMLQINQLGDTVDKIISLFKGNTEFDGITLSQNQLNLMKVGCALSIVYAIAMASLAAKWILPVIGGAALLGSLASPLGIIVCIALVIYGIIYGLLTARGWANLVLLDARLKKTHHFGLLSFGAVKLYLSKLTSEFDGYWDSFKNKTTEFFYNLLILILLGIQGEFNSRAAKKCVNIFFDHFLIGTLVFLLKLTRTILRVTLGALSMYGLFYTLDEGCSAIGETLGSPETGEALTAFNFAAQAPFMIKNVAEIALPTETPAPDKEKPSPLNLGTRFLIEFYRILNAGRNMLVPTGGEVPQTANHIAIASSTATASYIAVKPAADNLVVLQESMQRKDAATMNTEHKKSSTETTDQYAKQYTANIVNYWKTKHAVKKTAQIQATTNPQPLVSNLN